MDLCYNIRDIFISCAKRVSGFNVEEHSREMRVGFRGMWAWPLVEGVASGGGGVQEHVEVHRAADRSQSTEQR